MPYVISASRRTDIPAFYTDWFVRRLKAGSAIVLQPYSGRPSRVSLLPADVSAIVFWSKNYGPLLSKLGLVERTTKNLFFHFTITANETLELSVPDHRAAIPDYRFLTERYSPEQIIWRFDPLCMTDKLSFEMHEERFSRCAELLRGLTKRCIISFVYPYKKVLTNLKKYSDHSLLALSNELKQEYAQRLAKRAAVYGITLFACSDDGLLSADIQKASCIDGRALSELFGVPIDTRQATSRKECGCTRSIDIGAYNTCGHGCLYCYANADKDRARAAVHHHDPSWNALGTQVEESKFGPAQEQQALFKE
jgi:hypothetical protein